MTRWEVLNMSALILVWYLIGNWGNTWHVQGPYMYQECRELESIMHKAYPHSIIYCDEQAK